MRFFIFSVTSVGQYGQPFAVGGGLYQINDGKRNAIDEFNFAIDPHNVGGSTYDVEWVKENVPPLDVTHTSLQPMAQAFMEKLEAAIKTGAKIACDLVHPRESHFLFNAVTQRATAEGEVHEPAPTEPLYDIHSIRYGAGAEELPNRRSDEQPAHDPLMDARYAARLLAEVMD
jgi:hypothetical protein